jgi:CBS domain-containing protein
VAPLLQKLRVMRVRVESCVLVTAPQGRKAEIFEAVRERVARVGPRPHHGHAALRHAAVPCRPHELVTGTKCTRCGHLLNAVPAPDGESVKIRCVFFESDPVTLLMACAEDLAVAEATESLAVAAARMLDRDVEQLVVASGEGEAVGLVTAQGVEGVPADDERVGDRVVPLPVVPRTMTLGALAAALRQRDLECVGVVDDDELVGLVTRGDLRRAGVPGL